MRLRYDLYIEFDAPQSEDAGAVAREVGNDIEEGLMGISGSSLHEDDYVLTASFFLDPSLIFDDVEARHGGELPEGIVDRIGDEFVGYVDVMVQRVTDEMYES